MAQRIALVERAADVARLPDDCEAVPVTAQALLALRLAGRRATLPGELVADSVLEEVGAANFARTEAVCERIDRIWRARAPGDEAVTPAAWSVFALKILVDALSLRAVQLARMARARPQATFVRFGSDEPGSVVPIGETEALYAQLLPLVSGAVGARYETLPSCAREVASAVSRPSRRRSMELLVAGLRARAADRWALIGRRAPADAPAVLCADYQYNVPAIARAAERAGLRALVWWGGTSYHRLGTFRNARFEAADAEDTRIADSVSRAVAADDALREILTWEGIDLSPALLPRLEEVVRRSLPSAVASHRIAARVLEKTDAAAVLMSTPAAPAEKALCAAARTAGVPTVISSHGGFGVRQAPLDYYGDLDAVDWALCWGDLEAEAWRHPDVRRFTSTKVVGSPVVEAMVSDAPSRSEIRRQLGIDLRARVVLYAPTTLSGNSWYAGARTPTDPMHLDHQLDILERLAGIERAEIVVKEHPGAIHSLVERWAAAFTPRVRVIRQPAFGALIHLADAVVLDIPSTTVVQALFGSAPIYPVTFESLRWTDDFDALVHRHGIPVCTREDVAARVESDLDRKPAETFAYAAAVRERLVASGPPGAAERAALALREIAAAGVPDLRLRPARTGDAQLLLDWRNDPETLAASGNTAAVRVDEHRAWLERVIRDEERHLFIGELHGHPVGQIRLELRDGIHELSVSIAREWRGQQLGARLIELGCAWLCELDPAALVRAYVRPANAASVRAFQRAGFVRFDGAERPGFVALEWACL